MADPSRGGGRQVRMKRDLLGLVDTAYDVVVVGGGIHGACIAWDATLRGLKVGLIEAQDFGGATSANSLRIVHGGLRYLARGDFRRMRESIRERRAFLRIAPTLVEPLAVIVPTRGMGTQSRAGLGTAVVLNDLCSLDRDQGVDADRRLPRGRLLSLDQCRRLFPSFPSAGTTGGALWYDARMRHPERLTLAFVRAAAGRGAQVANYCRMERLLADAGTVRGVAARDVVTGRSIEIRGRTVVLAAGPWTGSLAGTAPPHRPHAFGLNLVIGRRLAEAAIGVRTATPAGEDPIIGGRRFIFLAPQGDTTLLGTWYAPAQSPTEELIQRGTAMLLREVRESCPGLELDAGDVAYCQWGLLPLKAGLEPGRSDSLADRPQIRDHGRIAGLRGMFSVEGVKYTTARQVAEDVVDRVVAAVGGRADRCRTAVVRVDENEPGATSLEERVRGAVRDEMAMRLADVVFRRVWSGPPPEPSADTIAGVARIAGSALGWSAERQESEIEDVMRQIRSNGLPSESLA